MSKKKYAAIGGVVDGKVVSAYYVAAMHEVNLDECLFFSTERAWDKYKSRFLNFKTLRPSTIDKEKT